jgi:shikimate kinase
MVNMIAMSKPVTASEARLQDISVPACASSKHTSSAPTLLLMAGFAGAGKTTLAKRLSTWLHWEVLNKDDLKLQRLANGEEVGLAGWNAFEELFDLIQEAVVEKKQSVIIDTSNEWPFIIENILHMQNKLRSLHIYAQLKVILCVATKETRTRRLNKRGSVFAPYVHELPTILDDAELSERFKHLPADKILTVHTDPPLNTYDWKVLKQLQLHDEL